MRVWADSTQRRSLTYVTARRAGQTAMVYLELKSQQRLVGLPRAKSFGADLEGSKSNHSSFVAKESIANKVKLKA